MGPTAEKEPADPRVAPPGQAGPGWESLPPKREEGDEHSFFHSVRSRLVRLSPRPIVRLLARPYIPGETRTEAMQKVSGLFGFRGLHSTVDVLGEAITRPGDDEVQMLLSVPRTGIQSELMARGIKVRLYCLTAPTGTSTA